MLNKNAKRSLKIFLSITLFAICFNTYANTNMFTNHLKYILNNIAGININFSEVKIKNFSKIIVKDIDLRLQTGEEAIKAKLLEADITLLAPTILKNVTISDGLIYLERKDSNINLVNILDSSDNTSYKKSSILRKLEFKNVDLKYMDKSYDEIIKKDFFNVNGYLKNNLRSIIDLKASADSIGKDSNEDEKLNIEILLKKVNKRNDLLDMFSLNEFEKNELNSFYMNFKFVNFDIDNNLAQYVEVLKKVMNIKKGKLEGTFGLELDEKDEISLNGQLDIKDANLRYFDYNDELKNMHASIKFDRSKIYVDAKENKIDNGDANLEVYFDMNNSQLDLELSLSKMYYKTLNKYSLINKFNLGDLKSDYIDSKLSLGINLSDDEFKINKFIGNIKTDYINIKGLDINKLNINLGLEKENVLKINTNDFTVYKNMDKSILNLIVNTDLNYDVSRFDGKGNFNIYNKSNFSNLSDIKGNFEIKENKNIILNAKSSKIDINSNLDIEKSLLNLTTKSKDLINIKYNDLDLDFKLNSNKLLLDIKNLNLISGNMDFNARLNTGKYFDNLNTNIFFKDNNLISKGKIFYEDGSLEFNGLNGKVNVYTNNFPIDRYISGLGVNIPDKLVIDKLNINGILNVIREKEKIKINFNIKDNLDIYYNDKNMRLEKLKSILLYNINDNNVDYLLLNANASMPNKEYFDNLDANISLLKDKYNVNAQIIKDDGAMILNGHTTKDLYHDYEVSINNFDVLDFAKGLDIKALEEFESEKKVGKIHIYGKTLNDVIQLNVDSNDMLSFSYKDMEFEVKPIIDNLVFDTKTNELKSGILNINAKMKGKKYFDELISKVIIDDDGYNVSTVIKTAGGIINLSGISTKTFEHDYDVTAKGINIGLLLDNVDMLNSTKLEEYNMPVDFKTKLRGKGTNVSANMEASSEYGEFSKNLGYENLSIIANINDLINLDADINLYADELWVKYQRFDNIKSKIKLSKEKVDVYSFGNDKLKTSLTYTFKDKNLSLKSSLNAYNIYTTNSIDANLITNNLYLQLDGKIDDLSGKITIDESPVLVSNKEVAKFKFTSNIKNSIVTVEEFNLRDYNLTGNFDINNQKFDFNLNAKEDNINDIVNLPDLDLNISTYININGNFEKININGNVKIEDISYKFIKVPKVNLELSYKDGLLNNILKTGMLNIKNFEVKNSKDKSILSYKGIHDLSNLNIDYRIDSKEIDLSKIDFLDSSKYSGKLKLDSIIRYNNKDMFGALKINSDELVLNSFKISNIDVDLQGNNEGINIPDVYFEYEDNPFLVDGYMYYLLTDYNFRLVANDFNLKFLEISDKIEKAGGKINLNLYTSKKNFEGSLNAENIIVVTKDRHFDLNKLNSKINFKNNGIEIDELKGDVNSGNIDIEGRISFPEIASDFMKSKNIILKPIDLKAIINNVKINYGNDLMFKITTDLVAKDNTVKGNILLNEGEVYSIPSLNNKNSKNRITSYMTELRNQILQNMLKQYVFDISLETEKNVKLNIPSAFSLVKKISGDVYGNSKSIIENGNINLGMEFNINNGSFELNGHTFKIIEGIVKNSGGINPNITFKAVTEIDGDEITIGLNGKLNESNLVLSSAANKDKNEILGLLAFDESGGVFNLDRLKASSILGKALETTLNNFLLSTITNKVSSTLGINEFKITTNFDSANSKNVDDIISNTITTLYIQNNVLSLPYLFWNAELKFPISTSSKDSLRYNLWLNYNLKKTISTTLGIKSSSENKNKMAFYTGLQYSNKFNYFQEMFDDLTNLFRKKTELK